MKANKIRLLHRPLHVLVPAASKAVCSVSTGSWNIRSSWYTIRHIVWY